MPIIGGRQVGVRGLGFQGAGKPGLPSISSITENSASQVTIAYTLGASNGAPITSVNIVSSPSIALTYTATDVDGSIAVTGSFVANTDYTFTISAINAVGSSDVSSSSAAARPNRQFTLAQTFNSSGTYTVPSGTQKIAIYTMSGGGGGRTNRTTHPESATYPSISGGMGGKASGVIVNNPSVGTTYTVTVGAGGAGPSTSAWHEVSAGNGGMSSFGNLINSGDRSANPTGNASGIVSGNGQFAKGGDNGGSAGANKTGPWDYGFAGQAGAAGGNIVLTNANGFESPLPNAVQYGGGGGGGGGAGGGGVTGGQSGGAGGSPFGASGGGGSNYSGAGGGGTGNGPGGGGGGGGAGQGDQYRGAGGTGASGRVLVYVK